MRRLTISLLLALVVPACNGSTQTDTGADDTASQDATQGDTTDLDSPIDIVDMHRARDTAVEAQLDGQFGNCFASATPMCGAGTATFQIMGTGFVPSQSYMIFNELQGATSPVFTGTVTADASGNVSYAYTPSPALANGTYTFTIGRFGIDPCSFDVTLTVPCP